MERAVAEVLVAKTLGELIHIAMLYDQIAELESQDDALNTDHTQAFDQATSDLRRSCSTGLRKIIDAFQSDTLRIIDPAIIEVDSEDFPAEARDRLARLVNSRGGVEPLLQGAADAIERGSTDVDPSETEQSTSQSPLTLKAASDELGFACGIYSGATIFAAVSGLWPLAIAAGIAATNSCL